MACRPFFDVNAEIRALDYGAASDAFGDPAGAVPVDAEGCAEEVRINAVRRARTA